MGIRGILSRPVQQATLLVSIGTIVWAIFSPLWAWLPIIVLALLAAGQRFFVPKPQIRHVPELSPQANALLRRFWYFYEKPLAGAEFSASTSTIQMTAVVVAAIGAFQGVWWGLVGAALLWLLLTPLAREYNPSVFIRRTEMAEPHREIMEWMAARLSQNRFPNGAQEFPGETFTPSEDKDPE